MQRVLSSGLLAFCLACPTFIAQAQSMSHEEEFVRNAYAKLSLLCGLSPISDASMEQHAYSDLVARYSDLYKTALETKVSKATPTYTLSSFQVGSVASIASEPFGNFATPPQTGNVLDAVLGQHQFTYNHGQQSTWSSFVMIWTPSSPLPPEVEKQMLSLSVSETIQKSTPEWQNAQATYTRYAAFTVDATFQGKSTGPHKAIFFFGTDADGNEVVAPIDMISGTQAMWAATKNPYYPTALLQSKLRETPAVTDWIRANEVPADTCSTKAGDVCCSRGKCGLSQADVNRDLSAPTN